MKVCVEIFLQTPILQLQKLGFVALFVPHSHSTPKITRDFYAATHFM